MGPVASLAVVWMDDGYFKTGGFVYDSLPIQNKDHGKSTKVRYNQ